MSDRPELQPSFDFRKDPAWQAAASNANRTWQDAKGDPPADRAWTDAQEARQVLDSAAPHARIA
jgi:hypothetical protein